MIDQIYCTDCVEGMKKLPSNSVQVIVTSPPYNINKNYNGYKDNLNYQEYLEFLRSVFAEGFRILKDEGLCFVNVANNSDNQFKAFDIAYLLRSIGFELVDTIIWYKPNPRYFNTQKRLTNSYEFIFMLAKSKDYTFNKLAIGVPCKTKNSLKCRTNVWSINRTNFNQFNWIGHCAIFPVELPLFCIKLCSNINDLVLDPFMGSGTTAVAAKKLNRHFLGFEISPFYAEICKKRLGVEK